MIANVIGKCNECGEIFLNTSKYDFKTDNVDLKYFALRIDRLCFNCTIQKVDKEIEERGIDFWDWILEQDK